MLTETGRVVALEQDSAWVETLRQSACGSCAARGACGHGVLNRVSPKASRGLVKVRVPDRDTLDLALHDTVRIALPESGFLRAASLLYLLPLATMLALALLTQSYLLPSTSSAALADGLVALAAALGLALGLMVLRYRGGRIAQRADMQPFVTEKVTQHTG